MLHTVKDSLIPSTGLAKYDYTGSVEVGKVKFFDRTRLSQMIKTEFVVLFWIYL